MQKQKWRRAPQSVAPEARERQRRVVDPHGNVEQVGADSRAEAPRDTKSGAPGAHDLDAVAVVLHRGETRPILGRVGQHSPIRGDQGDPGAHLGCEGIGLRVKLGQRDVWPTARQEFRHEPCLRNQLPLYSLEQLTLERPPRQDRSQQETDRRYPERGQEEAVPDSHGQETIGSVSL